jgi:hypothetical protein
MHFAMKGFAICKSLPVFHLKSSAFLLAFLQNSPQLILAYFLPRISAQLVLLGCHLLGCQKSKAVTAFETFNADRFSNSDVK